MAFVFVTLVYGTSQAPTEDRALKLEKAKFPPVTFSHKPHVDKQKIGCATCHHMDAADPKACTTCHKAEVEGKVRSTKDAFHGQCITCHKAQAEKAGNAVKIPTKCNECHKR